MILDQIAGDVGKLEGEAEIGGAVERVLVGRIDAHDHRHHAADRAGDMVAIAQHVVLALRPPALGVEREAGEMIVDEAARDRAFGRDDAQRVERRDADRLAGQRAVGRLAQEGDARARDRRGATALWPSVWPSAWSSQARHQQ